MKKIDPVDVFKYIEKPNAASQGDKDFTLEDRENIEISYANFDKLQLSS